MGIIKALRKSKNRPRENRLEKKVIQKHIYIKKKTNTILLIHIRAIDRTLHLETTYCVDSSYKVGTK